MKVIVCLTSYHERLKNCSRSIFSILNGTYKDVKIVLTLYKDDVKFIPEDLKLLIDNNIIELIIAEENYKPHLKYFYVMKKYKDFPIITIDDDVQYYPDTVENLVNCYKKYPNCISARRCHQIKLNSTCILPYRQWTWEEKSIKTPSKFLFATGVGGVLYPPNILDIDSFDTNELVSCIYNDDLYLKLLELRKDINTVWSECKPNQCHPFIWNRNLVLSGLQKINTNGVNRNDEYVKQFDFFSLLK